MESKPTPTFDTLPIMVYGLKQEIQELRKQVDKLVNAEPKSSLDEQRIYGDKALAEYLNCTIQTISRIKNAGKLPFHDYSGESRPVFRSKVGH